MANEERFLENPLFPCYPHSNKTLILIGRIRPEMEMLMNIERSGSSSPAERLEKVVDLVEVAGGLASSTVVVVGGHRIEDLRLVESARDHGIVDRIILVGVQARIAKSIDEIGINIDENDIVPADNDNEIAARTVDLIKAGGVDIVIKGAISTPIINRAMLPLACRPTVSLTTLFDAVSIGNGRPMIMTDAGVTTVCNFGRMRDLVRNAVDVAQVVMGIEKPRVAILSANEKQIPSLPSTWIGLELAKRKWDDAIVCGPLSFDLATDPASVSVKGLPDLPNASEVAGQADILVCPGIDTANTLYKTISAMNKFGEASLASITLGFPVPYIILSRSDGLETRIASIALSAVYAQRNIIRKACKTKEAPKHAAVETYRVLTVNPGSTSLKVALYENEHCLQQEEISWEIAMTCTEAERDSHIELVTQMILGMLQRWGYDRLDAIASRGGFLPRPSGKLSGGIYSVAEKSAGKVIIHDDIVAAVRDRPERKHPANYGAPIAAALAMKLNAPAVLVDPVVVDEFSPEAEISGYKSIIRRNTSHALSIKAAARRASADIGRPLEDMNLVAAHLGGGITVAALRKGKIVDSNISLLGGGPFTPQRAGELPIGELIDLCYSGHFTCDELIDELTSRGGLRSYLGTDRMEHIEELIGKGDKQAALVVEAMTYQIAKEIGKAFVAAGCDVEAIVLTGGLTRSKIIKDGIRRRIIRLAPVMIYEGSLEMAALADGAADILSGRKQPILYKAPEDRQ
ncbi:MAG TPA: butyrate kinase [Dissulfurispiraceae bacterium]|nr:butyrate kinase [Dissulfurispiraceae bacterium]